MNEGMDKTSSSLAIVEKRPQKPGGCVGIFMQLFDWNRSFSKKKLISNKLLPPAHPQQSARKYGGDDSDENLPKHRLIANENSGGFPIMKKNGSCNIDSKQKPQMRPPSLVARLMGLDSMPAVQKNKSSKESESFAFQTTLEEENKFMSTPNGFNSDMMDASRKNDLRPQKLRKMEPSGKQALSKFTAEPFEYKSLLSRSRKHHRQKLISPLKSPRTSTMRTSSRLIDVATRMLEPGLQATNKAKSAITYSSNVHNPVGDCNNFVMKQKMDSPDIPKSSLKAQSCRNCGSQLKLDLEEKPVLPTYPNPNVEELKWKPLEQPTPSFEEEKWRVSERCQEISVPFTSQTRNTRKLFSGDGQNQSQWKPERDSQFTIGLKYKIHRQNEISMVKDKMPNRLNKVSSTANAVTQSKHINSRMPTKTSNAMRNDETISCNKRGGSLSPMRKRMSTSAGQSAGQNGESSNISSSTVARQKNARCNSVQVGESKPNSCFFNSTKYKINDGNSVTLNSSAEQRAEVGITRNKACDSSVSGNSDVKVNAEKLLSLGGDELGALLHQKLRDLSCQEEDELAIGSNQPKRTTAVILQELISALTTEKPMFANDGDVAFEDKVLWHSPQVSNKKITFKAKQKAARTSLGYLHEGEHLSPGSVLEASFSNDSCLSSSFGDRSAAYLITDSVDFYFDGPPKFQPDAEIFDSAAPLTKRFSHIQFLLDLTSHVSEVLLSLGYANTGLKRSKLEYAKEVIFNFELISGNSNQCLSLGHFLVYELENLARAMWVDFGNLLGFKDRKNEKQFKEFVIDCVMEYQDTRYGQYSSCGFVSWTTMVLYSTGNEFVAALVKEVRKWMTFAEYPVDDVINLEMCHSNGKWADFETEGYETVTDIGTDVLQKLVDEIMFELLENKSCSKRI